MGQEDSPRVLSIQSHVVSGYVGNKSAVFPLQILGFEVDMINSVQFSNHTGYPHFKGHILDSGQLGQLIEGLELNNLHSKYSHLLTGYIGSTSFLEKVSETVKLLKSSNRSLTYVCDPVMGDEGKLYVTPDLLPIYQNTILPLADIVTPNQFEAELLTGVKITNLESAFKAIDLIHDKGVKLVVISSTNFYQDKNFLLGLASDRSGSSTRRFRVLIPSLDAHFTGTGDLFAALLLAWHHRYPHDLKQAMQKVLGSMRAILQRTFLYGSKKENKHLPSVERLELKLIQSRKDIEEPPLTIQVDEL